MSRKTYPLEVAQTLRAEEEAACGRRLVDARHHHELAAEELRGVEEALSVFRDETKTITTEESLRDRAGRSLDEMLRTQSFLDRRRRKEKELISKVEHARACERATARDENEATAAFALAVSEKKAIEEHHAAWLAARRAEQEKHDEEESEDQRR